jgi:hypothetical protein
LCSTIATTLPPKRLRARQRVGAEEHQCHAVGGERSQRALERIGSPRRRFLPCPAQIGVGESSAQHIVIATVHDADRLGFERPRGRQHVRQQRPPTERMQNFRQRGTHPLTFAGGQDCDLQG